MKEIYPLIILGSFVRLPRLRGEYFFVVNFILWWIFYIS